MPQSFTISAWTTVLPMTLAVCAVLVEVARQRRWTLGTLAWRLAFAGYLAALVTVTFFPFSIAIGSPTQHDWRSALNLEPGRSFELVSYKLNILMTVPLGFLLPVVARIRNVFAVTAVGMLTSCTIELLQLLQRLTLGGTRSTDVDDVIANTIGTFVGVLAFHVVAAVFARRSHVDSVARPRGGQSVGRSADSADLAHTG